MELPQHWVTADGFSPHLGQAGGTLTVWGWSTESEADAVRVANQRLAEALERVAREGGLPAGHGYYPRVPLREPVLEEVDAASGPCSASSPATGWGARCSAPTCSSSPTSTCPSSRTPRRDATPLGRGPASRRASGR